MNRKYLIDSLIQIMSEISYIDLIKNNENLIIGYNNDDIIKISTIKYYGVSVYTYTKSGILLNKSYSAFESLDVEILIQLFFIVIEYEIA